jgi:uncharacterized protein (DUF2336 family)
MPNLPTIETSSRLSEVQDLLRQLPAPKRGILLKSVTELFVEGATRFKPMQVKMFDSLFNELIVGVDTEILAGLSRRLAPIANSPKNIIGRLALSDDITIAEPVLLRSPCVDDAVLIDIARTKSQTHLLAIACRTELAVEIVDLLIARGDEVAVRYVANNKGARISDASAAALAERAKSDEALAELIAKRRDITQRVRAANSSKTPKGSPIAPAAA